MTIIDRNKAGEFRLKGWSYEAIGKLYGVSRQRIHQVLTGYKSKNFQEYRKVYRRYYKTTENGKRLHRVAEKRLRQRVKKFVLSHYGNGQLACVSCSFHDIRALTIDHIEGGGNKHKAELKMQRGGSRFYNWLIKNDYPLGYQTLCMNCQLIKRFENSEW